MKTTPAHEFMFVSVHYVDNVRNVKTNRGGITGHMICDFLAYKIIIHTIFLCNFINFISYVYFIAHIVAVFLCLQINK